MTAVESDFDGASQEHCMLVPGRPNVSPWYSSAEPPASDRAGDALASGTPTGLRNDLVALLGAERVLSRPIDLIRYASDASPYRLFPKVVVVARDGADIQNALS